MEKKNQDEFLDIQDDDLLEVNAEYEKKVIERISARKTQLQSITSIHKQQIKQLVKLYYEMQRLRITADGMTRSAIKNGDEELIVNAFVNEGADFKILEGNIASMLEAICNSNPVGRWLLSICGIGPVLAAGLLSYFDVTKANYASGFISYAGLNDNNRPWLGVEKSREILNDLLAEHETDVIDDEIMFEYSAITQWAYDDYLNSAYNQKKKTWSKTEIVKTASKIPYNKELKSLLWKVGQSINYQKNREQSVYGKLLRQRTEYEVRNNEAGKYADYAQFMLDKYNFGKDTEAYKYYIEGKLPPAHINARAMRWVEKILVCHLFEEMYRVEYDRIPPRYYVLEHVAGHHDEIDPEVPYTSVSGENEPAKNDIKKSAEELELEMAERAEIAAIREKYAKMKKMQKYPERFENQESEVAEEKPKAKPGRPKKTEEARVEEPKKKRGRPAKNKEVEPEKPAKRGPGRPRKNQ